MSDATRPVRLIPFGPKYRASGVLLHITSLPSPYGIGDVGPAAFAMVDRLQAAGQSWWQALPLGPTGYGNSPYQSLSSFAGNGLLISPDGLIDEGLLRASDCDEECSLPRNAVNYKAVIPFKHKLFEIAWNTFSAMPRSALRLDYDKFSLVFSGRARDGTTSGFAESRGGGPDEPARQHGRQLALALH